MSDVTFAEYVRSGAFTLSLSETMIYTLLVLYEIEENHSNDENALVNTLASRCVSNMLPLLRRGLVSFTEGVGCNTTKEGRLVAELLKLAKFAVPMIVVETKGEEKRNA